MNCLLLWEKKRDKFMVLLLDNKITRFRVRWFYGAAVLLQKSNLAIAKVVDEEGDCFYDSMILVRTKQHAGWTFGQQSRQGW